MDEEEENQNKILIKFNTLSRFVYSICHMNVNIGYRCVSHDWHIQMRSVTDTNQTSNYA